MRLHQCIGLNKFHVEAIRPTRTVPIVVHIDPVSNKMNVHGVWCVSQLIDWNQHAQLIVKVDCKAKAMDLCQRLTDRGFNDSRVEWQESGQVDKVSEVMRGYDPVVNARWGERWTYTDEYARRVMSADEVDRRVVPVYTVTMSANNGNSNGGGGGKCDWWYGWGKYKGVWDVATLMIADELLCEGWQQQRMRRVR